MGRLLAIFFCFGAAFTALAQSDNMGALYINAGDTDSATLIDGATPRLDSLWELANDQYANGNYTAAAATYAMLINNYRIANTYLYYNAANAFFKQNEIAKSILYYEKALKLAPNNEDILYNLRIAEQHTVDKIDAVPEFFVVRWIGAIPKWLGVETWGVLSLLTFAGMLALLLLINIYKRQRMLVTISAVLLVVSLVTLRIAVVAKHNAQSQEYAIVMLPVTTVKSSPDNSSTDLFILHEGAKLQMIETIGSWVKIKIADGNQGWIQKNGIEVI
jgi:tetratricopeptide (TPR) repeat protein